MQRLRTKEKKEKATAGLLARHDHQAIHHFEFPYGEAFPRGLGANWGGPYRPIRARLGRLVLYYISRLSLMAGGCLATLIWEFWFTFTRTMCLSEIPSKTAFGECFLGYGWARLIAGRRLWEGDSTTEAFVTHLEEKASSERGMTAGPPAEDLTMGKDMRRGDMTCTITPCYAYTPDGRALLPMDARDGVA